MKSKNIIILIILSAFFASNIDTTLFSQEQDSLSISEKKIDIKQENNIDIEKSSINKEGKTSQIIILILAFCVLALSLSTFYLYRWRIILSNKDGKEFIKPEDYNQIMNNFYTSFKQHEEKLNLLDQNISNQGNSTEEKINNMISTFMAMQKKLDEQDLEIKRLKKGYDSEIYKKFLMRFIRVNQIVNDNIKDIDNDTESKLLNRIKLRLDDALEECNVESFEPSIGSNIKDLNPDDFELITENTTDNFNDGEIIEVIEEGYKLITSDNQYNVLIPTKIKIYKYTEGNSNV